MRSAFLLLGATCLKSQISQSEPTFSDTLNNHPYLIVVFHTILTNVSNLAKQRATQCYKHLLQYCSLMPLVVFNYIYPYIYLMLPNSSLQLNFGLWLSRQSFLHISGVSSTQRAVVCLHINAFHSFLSHWDENQLVARERSLNFSLVLPTGDKRRGLGAWGGGMKFTKGTLLSQFTKKKKKLIYSKL